MIGTLRGRRLQKEARKKEERSAPGRERGREDATHVARRGRRRGRGELSWHHAARRTDRSRALSLGRAAIDGCAERNTRSIEEQYFFEFANPRKRRHRGQNAKRR